MGRAQLLTMRRGFQLLLQDPYNCIPPNLTVASTIALPLKVHGIPRREIAGKVESGDGRGRSAGRSRRPAAGGPERRAAPADQHRPGAGAGAAAPDPGRDALRPRPDGAGPAARPVREAAGGAPADLPVHQPRPRHGPQGVLADRGHVPRQDRGAGRHGHRVLRSRPSLHARVVVRRAGAGGTAATRPRNACSKASRRARSTCRPAAASAPAARSPSIAAGSRSRRSTPRGPGRVAACHLVESDEQAPKAA